MEEISEGNVFCCEWLKLWVEAAPPLPVTWWVYHHQQPGANRFLAQRYLGTASRWRKSSHNALQGGNTGGHGWGRSEAHENTCDKILAGGRLDKGLTPSSAIWFSLCLTSLFLLHSSEQYDCWRAIRFVKSVSPFQHAAASINPSLIQGESESRS